MRQVKVPAAFMRGGTSNAVVFDRRHLPDDAAVRERLFIAALGSPDPYGRQLDGMGGGISSLSKVCIVGPPSRPDADVDYTFHASVRRTQRRLFDGFVYVPAGRVPELAGLHVRSAA